MSSVAVQRKQDHQASAPPPGAASDVLQDPLTDSLVNKGDGKTSDERGTDGTEAGALAWSNAMGKFIGGNLYKAVAGQVSEAKLEGIAVKAVESGVDAFAKWMSEQATTPDATTATAKLAAELKKQLGPKAKELMDSDGGGWADKIAEFTDENPWIIASAALAAAVTYVVTNQKIPSLKVPIKLGGAGKLTAGATLGGGIMDLFKGDVFVKEMTGSYETKGGALKLDVKHKDDNEGTVDQTATLKLTDKEKYAKLYGERKMVEGEDNTGKVGMEIGHKNKTSSSYLRAEHLMQDGTDVTTFGAGGSLINKDKGFTLSGNTMYGTDGRYSASAKYKQKLNDNFSLSASGHASRMPGDKSMEAAYGGKLGLNYKKGNFSAGGYLGHDMKKGQGNTKAGVNLKWTF